MMSTARSASFAVLLASVLASPLRSQAAPVDMTADQFRLYMDYQDALKDSRVQKMPSGKRLGAIAKNFKVSEKLLKEAIARGDATGPTIGQQCETEIRSELANSLLKGRIGEVKVDATSNHVVTYVQWRNDDGDKLDEEAATVALIAARAAPITSTIAVWAKSPSGTKVFEAKISADAASRFNQERIAMFARARYIRVFEDVHNLYTGTPPTD
jgi:hypothetical protein